MKVHMREDEEFPIYNLSDETYTAFDVPAAQVERWKKTIAEWDGVQKEMMAVFRGDVTQSRGVEKLRLNPEHVKGFRVEIFDGKNWLTIIQREKPTPDEELSESEANQLWSEILEPLQVVVCPDVTPQVG